ncbi:hypothetical protein SUGI_0451090 [Cryptomeria japonica]|nr:hypothetical protein SUGI_0451090 [Cryptomeria japonica]
MEAVVSTSRLGNRGEATISYPLHFSQSGSITKKGRVHDVDFRMHTNHIHDSPQPLGNETVHSVQNLFNTEIVSASGMHPNQQMMESAQIGDIFGYICATDEGQVQCLHLLEQHEELRRHVVHDGATIHQILLDRHLAKPEAAYLKLRFIRSCSASLALVILEHLESAFGALVLEAYAMTEASHQMASNSLPHRGQWKPGSAGKLTGLEVGILDESGAPQPQGTSGQVCIRDSNVSKGYQNNLEAYKTAFQFGLFHTDHIGYLDKERYPFLIGRIKESIHRREEKISPSEVDVDLLSLLVVAQAVACRIPDEQYGEEMNVVVVCQENMMINEDIIVNYKKNLANQEFALHGYMEEEVKLVFETWNEVTPIPKIEICLAEVKLATVTVIIAEDPGDQLAKDNDAVNMDVISEYYAAKVFLLATKNNRVLSCAVLEEASQWKSRNPNAHLEEYISVAIGSADASFLVVPRCYLPGIVVDRGGRIVTDGVT